MKLNTAFTLLTATMAAAPVSAGIAPPSGMCLKHFNEYSHDPYCEPRRGRRELSEDKCEEMVYVISKQVVNWCGHDQHRAPKCGGRLASMTTPEEMQIANDLLAISGRPQLWVGGNQSPESRVNERGVVEVPVWEWSDNSPWFDDHGNSWREGEPNNVIKSRSGNLKGEHHTFLEGNGLVDRNGCVGTTAPKQWGLYILPKDYDDATKYPNCDHSSFMKGKQVDVPSRCSCVEVGTPCEGGSVGPDCSCSGGGNPTSYGDPHFKTWSGDQFDFHGGCDLVLLQNKEFSHGLGMNIHIRTSIRTWWSFIESAVVQIGDNTLEVMAGIGASNYWINGGDKMELQTGDAFIGDFPVHFRRVNDHHTMARIDLGNGDAIGIETFKDFVRVNIKNKSNTAFHGSSGLLGAYPDGGKIGRDGKTLFEDANEFGNEWQVLASEPSFFHTVEGAVQPPQKCVMPDDVKRSQQRRLGEVTITEEEAAVACARVNEAERDACIFDVLATDDKDMAGSY